MARPDQQPESQNDVPPHAQTQIQLSETQTDDHSQVVILNHTESQTTSHDQTRISRAQVLAIVSLTIRVATWLCLLASLIILASNTSTINANAKLEFNSIYAYRYMMSAIVIGFAYTSVQVLFEIYQVTIGKNIVTNIHFPKIIFYGDKFLLCMLATGVGAAFGATLDLKKNIDALDDALAPLGFRSLSRLRTKLDNFYNMAYVSAGFLLIAFLCSIVSSILSSLALLKR
ncbi:CASP-like protein 4D1 [Rutidosis leptorrhynchoides]|uniref:CASP-like protein 4D1 n=1 Tax=Rutidosis leptorrhynchoides TaxID=125765 RepID=UPI003A993EF6